MEFKLTYLRTTLAQIPSTSRCSSQDALVCSSDLSPSAHLFSPPSECSLMSLSSSKEGVCPSGALGMAPWPSSLGVGGWGHERLHVCVGVIYTHIF